jgi:hypothetical protein
MKTTKRQQPERVFRTLDDLTAHYMEKMNKINPKVNIALYSNDQKVHDAYDRMINNIFSSRNNSSNIFRDFK